MKQKTDDQLKHEVLSELAWDTRTWKLKIVAAVSDGVVTLTGIVPSYAQKIASQNAAHKVAGVLDVVNELVVNTSDTVKDQELARAVRAALVWSALVPDDQVLSTVSDGWVKLEGNVNSLTQRADAEWAVENLMGVKGVINEITVRAVKADPVELRDSIRGALERRADREASRLRIDVNDGEVDLHGRVHSWQERKAVLGSVLHAPGVKKVVNNLRIDPYF